MKLQKMFWELTQEEQEARMQQALKQLSIISASGIGMTCGSCGHFDDMSRFISTPVWGDLPPNQFQCPKCHEAIERRNRDGWIELATITARL